MLITNLRKPENQQYIGKRLAEIARMKNEDYLDAAMDLILSEHSRVETTYFLMSEDNVKLQLRQPWMKIGTDAGGPDPDSVRGARRTRARSATIRASSACTCATRRSFRSRTPFAR